MTPAHSSFSGTSAPRLTCHKGCNKLYPSPAPSPAHGLNPPRLQGPTIAMYFSCAWCLTYLEHHIQYLCGHCLGTARPLLSCIMVTQPFSSAAALAHLSASLFSGQGQESHVHSCGAVSGHVCAQVLQAHAMPAGLVGHGNAPLYRRNFAVLLLIVWCCLSGPV